MKRLQEIFKDLPVENHSGDLTVLVKGISYDSRKVGPGDAFVAIRGLHVDGHKFIPQAYQRGCRIFIVEEPPSLPDAIWVQVKDTRRWLPFIARNFYDEAVNRLKVIGITGTNGKTTTTYLVHSILQAAHWKPGLISTVEYQIGKEKIPATHTTPEALDLHRLFYQMVQQGCKSAVMEVSSHALELHRVDAIAFLSAVFTNLGHDHLDFHGDMENYFRAKKKLFDSLHKNARAVTNLDDPYGEKIVADCPAEIFTYSLNNPNATVWLKNYRMVGDGMFLELQVPSGRLNINSALVGKFNLYNILAATATAISLGLQDEFIKKGIEALTNVPGRAERITTSNGINIFIDYAHAPDALQRILEMLLEYRSGRLIVVFGCGGDRDRQKRPKMGKIAEDYADQIIITNDNPRSEDPQQIADEILAGIYDRQKVRVILDREEAIRQALSIAGKNDVVLIAGKGHEDYQIIGDRRIPFKDREVVERILSEMGIEPKTRKRA